jgi:hypothetical protein
VDDDDDVETIVGEVKDDKDVGAMIENSNCTAAMRTEFSHVASRLRSKSTSC